MNSEAKRRLQIFIFACVLAVLSYFYLDQSLSQFIGQDQYYRFRRVSRYITDLGEGGPYFTLSLLGYLFCRFGARHFAYFTDRMDLVSKYRSWCAFFFIALSSLGILNQLLKMIVGRMRPHKTPDHENFHFEPFNFHWHWHSFPSGHSQLIFVVGTCLSFLWPRHTKVFLFCAFYVALTRVFTHDHFLSDVIMGSVFGYLGTLILKDYFASRNRIQF